MTQSMDDIRALIDPEGFLEALQQAKSVLKQRLAAVLVDLDLTASNPIMDATERERTAQQLDTMVRDIAWRLQEADKRIAGVTAPLVGGNHK
jgi:hypothetical protein